MHPHHKAAFELAQHLHTIEEFQRDIEPAIVAARNEFLTQETILTLSSNDLIRVPWRGESRVYTLRSRSYTFSETDVDRIRDVYDAKLKPLGFTLTEQLDPELVGLIWANPKYNASVTAVTRLGVRTATHYSASYLRSDGSTDNPAQLLPLEGRVPDWLTPELTEKYRDQ